MSIATQLSFSTATSILAGTAGALLYQQNVGATTFLTIASTSGWILQSTGSVPQWAPASGVASGSATNLAGGTAGQVPYQTGAGATSFFGPGTAGNVLVSNGTSAPSYNSTLTLASTNQAGTTNTGALIVPFGGVGVGGNLVVGGASTLTGAVIVASATQSGTTGTGALTVPFGGLGVGGNLVVGGVTTVTNSSAASSTATGALRVTGGVGIGGNLYVGGNTVLVGNLTVQGTTVIVDSTVTNISDPIFILGTTASGGVQIVDDNRDRGIAFYYFSSTNKIGFFGYDDSTNFWTYVPDATITGEVVSGTKGAVDVNLAGGTAMSVVYQSAANTTAFLGASSTSGWLLSSQGTGSAPVWANPSGVSAGTASNLAGGTAGQVPYQTGAGATSFFGPGTAGNVLVSNGTSAPTYNSTLTLASTNQAGTTNTGALIVPFGGVGVGGNLVVGGVTTVTNSLDATSTASGALQIINGGVGVGKAIVAGGTIYAGANSSGALLYVGQSPSRFYINTGGNVHRLYSESTTYDITISPLASTTTGLKISATSADVVALNTTNATSTGTGALQVPYGGMGIGRDLWVGGGVYATTKSFLIDHPTKPGMKLRYGSLEGPENGVYVRGKLTEGNTIELPEYWTGLVDPDSITVTLTPIGKFQKLYVESIADNKVIVGVDGVFSKTINCFYTVWAERKDVDKLVVEIDDTDHKE